jgi:hypothetical protein
VLELRLEGVDDHDALGGLACMKPFFFHELGEPLRGFGDEAIENERLLTERHFSDGFHLGERRMDVADQHERAGFVGAGLFEFPRPFLHVLFGKDIFRGLHLRGV